MKIASMELFPVALPLSVPFTTALHNIEVKNSILVRLETDDGLHGWGEAAPELEITGDDSEGAFALLDKKLRKHILKSEFETEDEFTEMLVGFDEYISESSSAVAAVDIALHDLWAKQNKIPLFEYFKASHKPVPTSLSIGMMGETELFDTIRSYVDRGVRTIKLKIGSDIDSDLQLIAKFREAFGFEITLRLDANQGYSYAEALNLFKELEQFDIEFIEQPLPASDLTGLKSLNEVSPIPIMADEAVHSLADLEQIAELGIVSSVNIKLMKSGGLYRTEKMLKFCSENRIECMVGCMIETPIGIAAGVHLSMQDKYVKWTDLDGHLFLNETEGIFSGLETINDSNTVSQKPGLGVDIKSKLLKKFK
jgi:o-succinylbenzoate synthase